MPPRIRPLFSGPLLFTRATEAPRAPGVFREFVTQLEKLDAPPAPPPGRARKPRLAPRKRGPSGNGHARPRRGRRRT